MTSPGDPRVPGPVLAGTGRLADDLYLMAHNERTGRPLLAPRALGLGVAGAVLAELILADTIGITTAGQVTLTGVAPAEALAAAVASVVAAEHHPRPVGDWLAFLARTAPTDVGARLEQAGYLAAARSWRGQRRRPVNADCAFAPITRVKSGLEPAQADIPAVTLAALAAACGLGAHLALYLSPAALHQLPSVAGRLMPPLRQVITQTQAAVDAAVLAHRI